MWENWTICANRQIKLNEKTKQNKKNPRKAMRVLFFHHRSCSNIPSLLNMQSILKVEWELCLRDDGGKQAWPSHTGAQLHLKVYWYLWAPAAVDYWRGQNYISALHELSMLSFFYFFIRKRAAGSVECNVIFHRNVNINTTNMTPQVHL